MDQLFSHQTVAKLEHHFTLCTMFFVTYRYEKSRHDAGVLVFDTNAGMSGYQSTYPATPSVHLGSPLGIVGKMTSGESLPNATAITEIGPGDTCHSISWFREQPDLLIFGINSKNLKVHDLRMSGTVKAAMINYTRLVYGVCVDPWLDYRVASHHENQVKLFWIKDSHILLYFNNSISF